MADADPGSQSDYLVYRSTTIASHPDVMFNTADLIVIALLAGGDYAVSKTHCEHFCHQY
jgi:hypothetical protein